MRLLCLQLALDLGRGPQRLMRAGITLIVLGHVNFILGAIVHGTVLRHVANPERTVTSEYTTANVISVGSGLLSITAGIVAILVSRNLLKAALHWALLCVSLLNCLLSAACSLGLALAISLTIASRGHRLIVGCNSSALPADARAAIATNDCPFDTTRIYVSPSLWFPSMVMAVVEAALSVCQSCCQPSRGSAHHAVLSSYPHLAMGEGSPPKTPVGSGRSSLSRDIWTASDLPASGTGLSQLPSLQLFPSLHTCPLAHPLLPFPHPAMA
uniref:Keratinocyte associated protein 3 n=1 Tax=Chelonoidis abingdonii TaxID=106734 RepID=A0A8C0H8E2_CHEAB